MQRLFAAIALLLFGTQLLSGCRMARYELEEPLDGQVIEVKSGDRLSVVLDENPTTGFVWQWECDDDEVSFARETIPPEDDSLCGAPGKVRIIIRVHRGFSNTTGVRLVYRRPWTGGEVARVIDFSLYHRPEDELPWK